MPTVGRRYRVPESPETLFDVASDIESYPSFVPNCVATRILKRDGDLLLVDNLFGWTALRHRFRSQAQFDPPHGLHIRSLSGQTPVFTVDWRFDRIEDVTEVTFRISVDLDTPLLAGVVEEIMESSATRIEAAFLDRVAARESGPERRGPAHG